MLDCLADRLAVLDAATRNVIEWNVSVQGRTQVMTTLNESRGPGPWGGPGPPKRGPEAPKRKGKKIDKGKKKEKKKQIDLDCSFVIYS